MKKWSKGIPLQDEDRAEWLKAIHSHISKCLHQQQPIVVACSALKESYRQQLCQGLAHQCV
ncbi:MAG: hypothetical protein R2795_15950 [Saprospiraceae bacterium]